jgi:hypothetical protein
MATVINNGRSITFEIDGDSYEYQASTVVLNQQNTVQTYDTLSGQTSIVTNVGGTLDTTVYTDWAELAASAGLMDSLWIAAEAGTSIGFEMVASNVAGDHESTFTGNCIPQFPTVGGPAGDALSTSITFVLDGPVTRTYS